MNDLPRHRPAAPAVPELRAAFDREPAEALVALVRRAFYGDGAAFPAGAFVFAVFVREVATGAIDVFAIERTGFSTSREALTLVEARVSGLNQWLHDVRATWDVGGGLYEFTGGWEGLPVPLAPPPFGVPAEN